MPYSPEDIVAYAFRIRARGYDRDEVDSFLDALADQIEQERAQSEVLEERVGVLEGRLAEADDSERALKRTLITVQDAADRALTEAQEEVAEARAAADREVAELRERTAQELAAERARAEAEAAEMVAAAQAEVMAQRERVRALQELDAGHRAQLREHLEGALAGLSTLPDPFADLDLEAAGPAGGEQDPVAGSTDDSQAPVAGPDGGTAGEVHAERDPWRRTPDLDEQPASGPGTDTSSTGDHEDDAAVGSDDGQGEDDRGEPPMWG